jgi:rfaE bifunctional protein nucleotidyltransferase chain/domain
MIASRNTLTLICKELKENGKKIVFTNGCFDILHLGHVDYLNRASKLGDVLIVGINSDASVKRLKGETRPINPEFDRAMIIDSLKCVDHVCIFDEETPYELIKSIIPSVLVKGGDYKIEDIVGGDIVRENGGTVTTISFVDGKSTTSIIEKMSK